MTKLHFQTLFVALSALAGSAYAAGPAKNVIFFLGDGMGPVPYTAARLYAVGEDGSLTIDTLPRTARIKTHSLDGQTTDSAPSMAAYMTGIKTRNEVLSMSAETVAKSPSADTVTGVPAATNNCGSDNGTPATTLLELAEAAGKATGAVSTARITHATPAATYAHVCHRNAEYEIARQAVPGGAGYNAALGDGLEVLMGGISYYFTPYDPATNKLGRPDGRNLVEELEAKGYHYVTRKSELDAAPVNARLLGLFDQALAQGQMSYDLDRDPTQEPSLAEMTAKAIDVLSQDADGYFLMVEGGRIDHALHGSNARRALQDVVAMDDAVRTALSKVNLADTLIVVTADHDHTMAFNGYGKRGSPILGLNVNYGSGAPSLDADGQPYTTLVFGNGPNRKDVRTSLSAGQVENIDYQQETAIRFASSETHGGGDVMLFAGGAGAEVFKGTMDNTRVFTLVKDAFGF